MRIAQIATCVAAVVSVPLMAAAVGPDMTSTQFLSAARCAAYESLPGIGETANIGWVQAELNAEARRQPAETAAEAHAQVHAIARGAATEDTASLRQARNAACTGANTIAAQRGAGSV